KVNNYFGRCNTFSWRRLLMGFRILGKSTKREKPQGVDKQRLADFLLRYLAKLSIIDIHDCLCIKILEIK
ncbi:MAG: hypothetical protein ACI4UK_03210, partial [Floccifex sp.]